MTIPNEAFAAPGSAARQADSPDWATYVTARISAAGFRSLHRGAARRGLRPSTWARQLLEEAVWNAAQADEREDQRKQRVAREGARRSR